MPALPQMLEKAGLNRTGQGSGEWRAAAGHSELGGCLWISVSRIITVSCLCPLPYNNQTLALHLITLKRDPVVCKKKKKKAFEVPGKRTREETRSQEKTLKPENGLLSKTVTCFLMLSTFLVASNNGHSAMPGSPFCSFQM